MPQIKTEVRCAVVVAVEAEEDPVVGDFPTGGVRGVGCQQLPAFRVQRQSHCNQDPSMGDAKDKSMRS